jgi:hypothetical protein
VVRHDVDDDLDPVRVQAGSQLAEVGQGAERRVHLAVIVYVVAAVGQGGRVERAEPHRVDAERGQVRDPGDDTAQVAQAVRVGVGEAARVDLVDHGLPPPSGAGGGRTR